MWRVGHERIKGYGKVLEFVNQNDYYPTSAKKIASTLDIPLKDVRLILKDLIRNGFITTDNYRFFVGVKNER